MLDDETAGGHCRADHAPHVREAIEAAVLHATVVVAYSNARAATHRRPLPAREAIIIDRSQRRQHVTLPAETQAEVDAAREAAWATFHQATAAYVRTASHALPRGLRTSSVPGDGQGTGTGQTNGQIETSEDAG